MFEACLWEPAADLELHWVSVHGDKDHFKGFAILFEFAVGVSQLGGEATAGWAPAVQHTVTGGDVSKIVAVSAVLQ